MDRFSLLLVIVGAINWGLVGLFQFDLIAFLFGGQAALVSRVLYTIVGAAGLWSISMLFSPRKNVVTASKTCSAVAWFSSNTLDSFMSFPHFYFTSRSAFQSAASFSS